MIENPKEVRFGDGGHVLDKDGDVMPLQDGFSFQDELELFPEAESVDSLEKDTKSSSQQERLRSVYELHGFLPRSANELSYIVGIDKFERDAASRVAAIMRRQKRIGHADKTTRTAASILNDFRSYFQDADPVRYYLGEVEFEVADAVRHRDRTIEDFKNLDGGEGRAMAQMVRRNEMESFINGEPTDKKFTFSDNKTYRERVPDFLSPLTLDELHERLVQATDEEQNRAEYWKAQIEDAESKVTSLGSEAARRIVGN